MAKQALTAKAYFSLDHLTEVHISPDGKKVIYVTQTHDLKEDTTQNVIWLKRLDKESDVLRLTSNCQDANPSWAPDSKKIAFTSKRDGKKQIYILNINGGEAKQIVTEQEPSSTLHWSPDGTSIAFKATEDLETIEPRYPAEPVELLPSKGEEKPKDKDTEAVKVITDFNFRADGKGMIYDKYEQLFILALSGNDCRQITKGKERIGDFVFSSNGNKIVYLVKKFTVEDVTYSNDIREVDLDNGVSKNLLTFDGSLNNIELSPDQQWLAISGADNSCPPGTGEVNVWLLNLKGKSLPIEADELVNLTQSQQANVSNAKWGVKGKSILYIKQWRGATYLCKTLFEDGKAGKTLTLPVTELSMIHTFDVATNETIAFIASDFTHLPQIFLYEKSDETIQISHLNQDFVQSHELLPAQKFSYKGADDWDIDGWLVRPLNYEEGRKYPTILSIHGGPTGAYYDSFNYWFQYLAHQGFAVVFTNPRGSVTYGSDFAQGVCDDWGGKDYQDIMNGLTEAINIGVVDENHVGVMGWSYGGYMTCWMVTQTDFFKAAVGGANISNVYTLYGCSDIHSYLEGLLSGAAFDLEEKYMSISAMRYVDNVKTPIMLQHGEKDIRCPISQSEQFYIALKRLGKEAVFIRYPGQYHPIKTPSYVYDRWVRNVSWFKHYLLT